RSDLSAVVAALPPADAAPPVLSGTAMSGQSLAASSGSWTGSAPLVYSYQWQRCDSGGNGCAAIAGATAASYRASAGDVGATLRARVTATNVAASSAADSDASAQVAPAPAPAPTPSGPAPPPAPGTWLLKFADEFDGSSLDLTKWRPN